MLDKLKLALEEENASMKTWPEYETLIQMAKKRVLEDYTEKHHIFPTSIGGDNDPENFADLKFKEHLEGHRLLMILTIGTKYHMSMVIAYWMMANKKMANVDPDEYENLRKNFVKIQSERVSGEGHPNYGKHLPESTRKKISEANKGTLPWCVGKGKKNGQEKIFSEEVCKKLSEKMKQNNPVHDPKVVKKIMASRKKSGADKRSSERMKKNNPAHDPEVKKKIKQAWLQKRLLKTLDQIQGPIKLPLILYIKKNSSQIFFINPITEPKIHPNNKGNTLPKEPCPYCGKLIGGKYNMEKHTAKCKQFYGSTFDFVFTEKII